VPEEVSLGELAVRFGLTLKGEPSLKVRRVATLAQADAGALTFFANSRYRQHLRATRASAVVVSEADAEDCPVAALLSPNPYLAYARIAQILHPDAPLPTGIHQSAVIAAGAHIAASASIGPLSVVEEGVVVGERVMIGPGCILQRGARVGDDSRLLTQVNL
jgi:UDP-3-O-[3-hydroxymyristoyl] glucosamine N-acyltransferase